MTGLLMRKVKELTYQQKQKILSRTQLFLGSLSQTMDLSGELKELGNADLDSSHIQLNSNIGLLYGHSLISDHFESFCWSDYFLNWIDHHGLILMQILLQIRWGGTWCWLCIGKHLYMLCWKWLLFPLIWGILTKNLIRRMWIFMSDLVGVRLEIISLK